MKTQDFWGDPFAGIDGAPADSKTMLVIRSVDQRITADMIHRLISHLLKIPNAVRSVVRVSDNKNDDPNTGHLKAIAFLTNETVAFHASRVSRYQK